MSKYVPPSKRKDVPLEPINLTSEQMFPVLGEVTKKQVAPTKSLKAVVEECIRLEAERAERGEQPEDLKSMTADQLASNGVSVLNLRLRPADYAQMAERFSVKEQEIKDYLMSYY